MKLFFPIAVIAILLTVNITNTIDKEGHAYFNKAIKNAGTTYLIARGLNGAISLIQDGEVAATPGGVGVSISPGEILDPLNDLIEQFSYVMLLATAVLSIQKLFLIFSGWWVIKAVVALFLVMGLTGFLFKKIQFFTKFNRPLLFKILILALSLRFMVPLVVLSNSIFESIFLNQRLNDNMVQIQLVEDMASEAESDESADQESWLSALTQKAKELGEYKEKASILKEKVSASVDTIINLIALFVIQTILFPLVFLYAGIKLVRYLFGYNFSRL